MNENIINWSGSDDGGEIKPKPDKSLACTIRNVTYTHTLTILGPRNIFAQYSITFSTLFRNSQDMLIWLSLLLRTNWKYIYTKNEMSWLREKANNNGSRYACSLLLSLKILAMKKNWRAHTIYKLNAFHLCTGPLLFIFSLLFFS